jgi:hypothetical protein
MVLRTGTNERGGDAQVPTADRTRRRAIAGGVRPIQSRGDVEYTAMHVRRGDELVREARGEAARFWMDQGHG